MNNKSLYGGSLVKVINSNLVVERATIAENEMWGDFGGFHMMYSHLDIKDSYLDGR